MAFAKRFLTGGEPAPQTRVDGLRADARLPGGKEAAVGVKKPLRWIVLAE
jgi:hypothetical protein